MVPLARLAVLPMLAVLLGLAGPPPAAAQEVVVSAAISAKDALEALHPRFVAGHPGAAVRYNWGASGALQKQIEAGAPVDVFVSAARRPMDELERAGLIVAASRRDFARNALVVVKPADSPLGLRRPADLLDPRVARLVIGNPRTVPAGQYAEQSLRALGLWERLRPRLILAENVRQALEYVARGEVDAGFVYTTDAVPGGARVREAFRPPEESYGPVLYPAAVVAASRQRRLAQAFVDLLLGPEGRAALARFGFLPPAVGAR